MHGGVLSERQLRDQHSVLVPRLEGHSDLRFGNNEAKLQVEESGHLEFRCLQKRLRLARRGRELMVADRRVRDRVICSATSIRATQVTS